MIISKDDTFYNIVHDWPGQEITGLAVDDRSRIVFFTVNSGGLMGVSADHGGVILVLSGLDEPRDLVLHQEKLWVSLYTEVRFTAGCGLQTQIRIIILKLCNCKCLMSTWGTSGDTNPFQRSSRLKWLILVLITNRNRNLSHSIHIRWFVDILDFQTFELLARLGVIHLRWNYNAYKSSIRFHARRFYR